mmetsp:Transcript_43223/g.122458  ORF Transcript_43223/g.122458 Transcript_43223/m.122458 type:complete len:267 (-) Transcript_43223:245-1045(-)
MESESRQSRLGRLEIVEDLVLDQRRRRRVVTRKMRPPAMSAVHDWAPGGWVVVLPMLLVEVVGREGRFGRQLEAILVPDGPHCVAAVEQLEADVVAEVDVAADHRELSQHTREGQIHAFVWELVQVGRSDPHRQLADATLRRQRNHLARLLPHGRLGLRLRHTHGGQQATLIYLVVECQQLHHIPIDRPSRQGLCAECVSEPQPQLIHAEEVPHPAAGCSELQYVLGLQQECAAPAGRGGCGRDAKVPQGMPQLLLLPETFQPSHG